MPARASQVRVVIADDHPIVRRGLCQILGADPAVLVVGEAENADETLDVTGRTQCDVIVLDLGLPGAVGFSVLKQLRERLPSVPVLILSMAPEEQFGPRAIRAGAAGYVTKRTAPSRLVDAIHSVAAGRLFVSTETGHALARDMLRPAARTGDAALRLSDRELEVLRLLGGGMSAAAIATRLGISAKSVSTYRARLLTKLGLDSTAALIRYALAHGIADE